MTYYDLMKKISDGTIKPTESLGIIFKDIDYKPSYKWSNRQKTFLKIVIDDEDEITSVFEDFNDVELATLEIEIITIHDTTELVSKLAKASVLEEIERMYIELDMDIDACQGCTSNLDVKFGKLEALASIIKYLGGDLDKDGELIRQQIYQEAKEERERKEKLDLFKHIRYSFFDALDTNETFDTKEKLSEIINKLNKLLDYIKENL